MTNDMATKSRYVRRRHAAPTTNSKKMVKDSFTKKRRPDRPFIYLPIKSDNNTIQSIFLSFYKKKTVNVNIQ